MRHQISGKKLNRAVKPRQALFRSLIASFIRNGELEISLAKAKAIRPLIDKLVTHAKKATLTSQRQVQGFLQNQELSQKIVKDLAPKFSRKSGYVKITRLSVKRSDAAAMARIEWSEKIEIKKPVQKIVKTPVKPVKTVKKIAKTKKVTKTQK